MDPVFRAPMRSRSVDTGEFEGALHGVRDSLVGIGEPLPAVPGDLSEAVLMSVSEHGEKSARMLTRFAELPDGAFVWTMTGTDEYRLGRIAGPWRYDDSEDARRTGIHQARPVHWHPDAFHGFEIPPAVGATFRRGGRNFQRIRDDGVDSATSSLWGNPDRND